MKIWAQAYPPNVPLEFAGISKPAYSIFADAVVKFSNNICLDFMGKTHTYAELEILINKAAAGLQSVGISKGDKVGLCLPNCPYYPIFYYAILQAGATVVNFNPLYTQAELASQIADSNTKLMVTLDVKSIFPKVEAALNTTCLEKIVACPLADALPPLKKILLKLFKSNQLVNVKFGAKIIAFNSVINTAHKLTTVKINPKEDIAVIQYTGGTTGVPKGAMLTHFNIVSHVEQLHMWLGGSNGVQDIYLAVIPFFHVMGMSAVLNLGIKTGSKILLIPRFELKDLLKIIHKHKPTFFVAVPTLFTAISSFPSIKKYNLSSIRFCISGGASLPLKVRENFENLTGCNISEGYGLTECSPVALCNPRHKPSKENSIGVPLSGTDVEIRHSDNLKKVCAIGKIGEICVKGPQVMAGYLNKPQENEETFMGKYLRTGDIGYMDEHGYVFLTDRLKEIIISSGYNIYPRVIEDVLYGHPAVEEAIVIGVPDEYRGEIPKAFIKLKAGSAAIENEILEFANENLNPLEKVSCLEIREELPKTLIGKLSKKELVAEEKAKLEKQNIN